MIQVLIQAIAGSYEKRLYNEKTLEYRGTRHVSRPYPYAYGFVLGTHAEDEDAGGHLPPGGRRMAPSLAEDA